MIVPNQFFDVKIGGKSIKHYRELGYENLVNRKTIIQVPPEHLMETSHQDVKVQCDCCGKIFTRAYRLYIKLHKEKGQDLCRKCSTKLGVINKYGVDNIMKTDVGKESLRQANLEKYGVESYSSLPEWKEKVKKTCLDKYGEESYSKTIQFHDKYKKTCQERFGHDTYFGSNDHFKKTIDFYQKKYGVNFAQQVPQIKEKTKKACLEKYGCDNPFGNKDIQNKICEHYLELYNVPYYSMTDEFKKKYKETCLKKYNVESSLCLPHVREAGRNYWQKRYGVDYPLQSDDFWENIFFKKMAENGKVWTSKPQESLFFLLKENGYNVILNYPVGRLTLDVALFLNNLKIDVEYDGWYWHQNKKKDRARDEVLKSLGWKIIRVRGGKEVPSLFCMQEAIDRILNGKLFTSITLPDWKEPRSEVQNEQLSCCANA